MRAVAISESLPITNPNSLFDIELPKPEPRGRDLLVEIKAISVNPVDIKVHKRFVPANGERKVLGWDAAGVVVSVGEDAQLFKIGDEVFYAGDLSRSGTNAEFHLVDERIVGRKPRTLHFTQAAALPLTAITAWETLFDRLQIRTPVCGAANALLIVGGAGGVGSIAIQLARQLSDVTVIATASRPESQAWCRELGAHHVIDHSKPLREQLEKIAISEPAFVFSTNQTDKHLTGIAELIAPQGRFALIDDPATLDVNLLKRKSVSLHWEFMFTRSLFQTADMQKQHELLNEIAALVDAGKIRTTLADVFGVMNAANLRRAHAFLETGRAIGKITLTAFPPDHPSSGL